MRAMFRPHHPVVLAVCIGCAPPEWAPVEQGSRPPAVYDPHPETPQILRDVALIDDQAEFTRPFVPGHRTTMDGRVALRVQGGPPGPDWIASELSFTLFVPEALSEPIVPGAPGAQIVAGAVPFRVVFPPALEEGVTRLGHHAMCDATEEFAVEGEHPNPRVCGPSDAHDCYDIVVVSSTSVGLTTQLWGTPVTVEVSGPKTAAAAIVDVVLGEPVAGATIPFTAEFTEPTVTMDGRLLTGRLGRFPRAWTNPETGEVFERPYDLAYAVLPPEASPCAIGGWTDFHPMSHAPHDPAMVGTYGLAAYPFRDTEGELIPDGEDMGGTYPWVDREGANVFMTAVHGRILEQSLERYPRRCVVEGCESYEENIDWDRGFVVAGLWTHGKLVHLDGMINNMDWAVGVTPNAHWMVDLYRDGGEPSAVRFGSGRFVDRGRNEEGPYPPGYTHNANIMDSLQNLFNHQAAARPVTPRDVVWVMSTGVATDEVVFDDLLDPNAFIVSSMTASITQLYDESGASMAIPQHHNGAVRTLDDVPLILAMYDLQPEQDAEIHLQNGATSLLWDVPAFGRVAAGTGRVEPVALGGIAGRGFWLSGTNEIRYTVPAQTQPVRDQAWTLGIYLDPRVADEEVHTLFRFPDGSGVQLEGRSALRFLDGSVLAHRVALPQTDGWVHLGLQMAAGNRQITVLVDGMPVERMTRDTALFVPSEGDLVVGEAGDEAWGFRGWIDDFVLLAHAVDPEVGCNHAGGTLVRVDDNPSWLARAEASPAWAHDAVAVAAGEEPGGRYACYTDHSDDMAAHLANLPTGTASVRGAILFPEGPLAFGVPRPDSSDNGFCLTCHHEDGQGGLSLDALELRPDVVAEHDERRQPTQPPRRVFGNIPAGWIAPGDGPGGPAVDGVAPAEGLLIDTLVLAEGAR
jgi:hypothetical protein